MTTHLSEDQLQQYRHRLLSGADLLAVSSHVAECDTCRERLASAEEVRQGIAAFRQRLDAEATAAEHLTYEEIAEYVDGKLGAEDASRVTVHARRCEACAADLREVEDLRRELGARQTERRFGGRIRDVWQSLLPANARILVPLAAACGIALLLLIRDDSERDVEPSARSEPVTESSPEPVEVIRDGERVVSIGEGGAVTGLETLDARYRAIVEGAVKTQTIQPPQAVADLVGTRGVLLGSPGDAAVVSLLRPVGTLVESDRPVLAWTSQTGAEYLVSLYDDKYSEAATSSWMRRTEWQVSRPLLRGARYSWQLTVRRSGRETTFPVPPAPEARFRVLSGAERQELESVRRAHGDSHLLLALVYARAGLLDDAEGELRALVEANPKSRVAGELAASVKRFRYNRAPMATKPAQ